MARERGLYRRKDSRFWWIGLVLPDGRRVCQSTGCINRTDAESYAVRLKNEAIEARQQGLSAISYGSKRSCDISRSSPIRGASRMLRII
jgi:hypothetical protein